MKLHVRKGDTVVVIAGKDKGKTGKVLTAIPSDNAVRNLEMHKTKVAL